MAHLDVGERDRPLGAHSQYIAPPQSIIESGTEIIPKPTEEQDCMEYILFSRTVRALP
jgi:hypothetical protein